MAQPQPQWREEPAPYREAMVQPQDQVRWGPIWGGVITTVATLIFLSVLGLAIGLTVFGPEGGPGVTVAGAVWGVIITLAAFFLGGYVAGRTAAVSGPMQNSAPAPRPRRGGPSPPSSWAWWWRPLGASSARPGGGVGLSGGPPGRRGSAQPGPHGSNALLLRT